MTSHESWTIGRLLKWTTDYLQSHGAESPRLEAEILLAKARGCSRIELYTSFEEEASESTRAAFRELVRRRADGVPVAYLVGHREFFSLPFRVTTAVLIPRPETELLVTTLLDLVKARSSDDAVIRIADVGTGSGIIAVCAAKFAPQAKVTAIDTSRATLEIARENALANLGDGRIEFLKSDLFVDVPIDFEFDYIISNPPYVSTSEMADLPREVKDHEPHLALHAGERGTEVIERLLPQAADRLAAGGSLLLEVSPMIAMEVEQMIGSHEALTCQRIIADHAGRARVVHAVKQ